jgi:hypothetical protein
MTERETLLAEIAEKQARLAEIDAEPDYEAWRPALEAYYFSLWSQPLALSNFPSSWAKDVIRGLIAAFAKAPPTGSVMGEAEIDDIAKRCAVEAAEETGNHHLSNAAAVAFNACGKAIRETLSRVQPRWPSEEGKVKLVIAIINAYHTTRLADTPVAQHILSKAFVKDAFARAYQTGEQP